MKPYAIAIPLLMLAGPAAAEGLSYDYIEGWYQDVELDASGTDIDGDGFGIGGSVEFADSWRLFASYGTNDFDFGVDQDAYSVGVGFFTPVGNNVDFVADVAYVSVEFDSILGSGDDDGFGLSAGFRGMVSDAVELAGGVNYVDLDDSGDDTSFEIEGWYYFSPQFAVGLGAEFGDDVTSYGINGRVYFGD